MRRVVIVIVGCWIGLVAPAWPQAGRAAPIALGMDVVLARPLGDFKRHVGDAWGINGSLAVRFGQRRTLGVRAEVAAWSYDEEITSIECWPCMLVLVTNLEVATRQSILSLGLGPELTVRIGSAHLGVTPQIGISRFATKSSTRARFLGVIPTDDEPAGHTSATTLWYGGGAGLTVPVRRRAGEVPVSAHAGVRFLRNGRVRYQTASEVSVGADGSVSFSPTVREANLVQLRLGLSLEIGAPGRDH